MVIVQRQPELLQVVFALGSSSCFSRLLNSRQQQRDENCNDGDDHQQFDESETPHAILTEIYKHEFGLHQKLDIRQHGACVTTNKQR